MKKIFLTFMIFIFSINFSSVFALSEEEMLENNNTIIPKNLTLTDRYLLDDMKQLRTSVETLKREIFMEIQDKEIRAIDKALSYSSSAVSFFSILITLLVTSIWIVGWKTVKDIKETTRESIDKETKKIIENFKEKIEELEKEQKINILWRQYNASEVDKEKLEILDKVYALKPESQFALLERSTIYLSMLQFDKVVEITSIIVNSGRKKHMWQALLTRASAYASIDKIDNCINDLISLIQISSDYKENILENKYFEEVIKNPRLKNFLK